MAVISVGERHCMYRYRTLTSDEKAQVLAYRDSLGFPLHAPPHFPDIGGLHLITAATYEHRPLLAGVDDRQEILAGLSKELAERGIVLHAWVVLPNHYHLLVDCASMRAVSEAVRRAHGRSARELNQRDQLVGRQVWYRFTDRRMRNLAHVYTTLNYIHFNPVKHRYTVDPFDWHPSSLHCWLERMGSDWIEQQWSDYPLLSYGDGWD